MALPRGHTGQAIVVAVGGFEVLTNLKVTDDRCQHRRYALGDATAVLPPLYCHCKASVENLAL